MGADGMGAGARDDLRRRLGANKCALARGENFEWGNFGRHRHYEMWALGGGELRTS